MKPHTGGEMVSAICNGTAQKELRMVMRKLIEDSEEDGKEHAMTWCMEEDTTYMLLEGYPISPYETDHGRDIHKISEPCIGGESEITYSAAECPLLNEKGSFHTHPSGDLRFSFDDYATAVNQKSAIECVGTMTDGSPVTHCDIINTAHDKYESFRDSVLKMYTKEYENIRSEFVYLVESGASRDDIERVHDKYDKYNTRVDYAISDAIDDGIIHRCSTVSNITRDGEKTIY